MVLPVVLVPLLAFWAKHKIENRIEERQIASTAHDPTPAQAGTTKAPSKVFISYRREDSAEQAGHIVDRIVSQFGADKVFVDIDGIPLGVRFRTHITTTLQECSVCLAVIGPQWTTIADGSGKRRLDDPNDLLRIEIETALELSIPVAPLFVGGAIMPDSESLPASLRPLTESQGMTIRPHPDFRDDVRKLLDGLKPYLSL